MRPLKLCLECNGRHREDGARCRPCERERQRRRNAARPQYAGTWRAFSKRQREAAGHRCANCGRIGDDTFDHEHWQVECRACNSRHRRNPA